MLELTKYQEELIKQIVDNFRSSKSLENRELEVLHLLAEKHGYALVSIEDGLEWKDDDA